jgi:hypothetical protein
VSYKLASLEPLEIEQAGIIAAVAKCGYISVKNRYKRWLKNLLGEHYYSLESRHSRGLRAHGTEGPEMRSVMRVFDVYMRKFNRQYFDTDMPKTYNLDLPEPLDQLNITDKVVDGELKITYTDMAALFDPVIDEISELIQSQIVQVEDNGSRVEISNFPRPMQIID